MLKAVLSTGRTQLLRSQNLRILCCSYGSNVENSGAEISSQSPEDAKQAEDSSVSTMTKPEPVPKKSFMETVEFLKSLKELDNFKMRVMATESKSKSKKSSKRTRNSVTEPIFSETSSSVTESDTLTQTGLGSESFETNSRITNSDFSTETSSSSESDSLVQPNFISSDSSTETGSRLNSNTNQTGLGLESGPSTQTWFSSHSDISTETGLGSEADTLNQTGFGTEKNPQTGLGLESDTSTQTWLCSQSTESGDKKNTQTGSESGILTVKSSTDLYGAKSELNETSTELDIQERAPKKIFPKFFSFAALVNENVCLQKLLALEVDLSTVQKNRQLSRYLVKCDFATDIAPYLMFLTQLDIENIGQVLTKNMEIVQTDLAVLDNRLNYLKSKGFQSKDVTRIFSNSRFLMIETEDVDQRLGHLQKIFSLSGKEVREVLTKTPKILNKPNMLELIKENKLQCQEFLGFSHMELKTILLEYPGFFMKSAGKLTKMFEFVHMTMELDHKTLVKNCHIFKAQLRVLQNRHLYLLKVRRAQYDPHKENFVPFHALTSGTNEDFCTNVAKTSLKDYYHFLECL